MPSFRRHTNKEWTRNLIEAIERLNKNSIEQSRQSKAFRKESHFANCILITFTAVLLVGVCIEMATRNDVFGVVGIIAVFVFFGLLLFGLYRQGFFSNR